jgi:hypothetical protein
MHVRPMCDLAGCRGGSGGRPPTTPMLVRFRRKGTTFVALARVRRRRTLIRCASPLPPQKDTHSLREPASAAEELAFFALASLASPRSPASAAEELAFFALASPRSLASAAEGLDFSALASPRSPPPASAGRSFAALAPPALRPRAYLHMEHVMWLQPPSFSITYLREERKGQARMLSPPAPAEIRTHWQPGQRLQSCPSM